jgi:hypothetical protein
VSSPARRPIPPRIKKLPRRALQAMISLTHDPSDGGRSRLGRGHGSKRNNTAPSAPGAPGAATDAIQPARATCAPAAPRCSGHPDVLTSPSRPQSLGCVRAPARDAHEGRESLLEYALRVLPAARCGRLELDRQHPLRPSLPLGVLSPADSAPAGSTRVVDAAELAARSHRPNATVHIRL